MTSEGFAVLIEAAAASPYFWSGLAALFAGLSLGQAARALLPDRATQAARREARREKSGRDGAAEAGGEAAVKGGGAQKGDGPSGGGAAPGGALVGSAAASGPAGAAAADGAAPGSTAGAERRLAEESFLPRRGAARRPRWRTARREDPLRSAHRRSARWARSIAYLALAILAVAGLLVFPDKASLGEAPLLLWAACLAATGILAGLLPWAAGMPLLALGAAALMLLGLGLRGWIACRGPGEIARLLPYEVRSGGGAAVGKAASGGAGGAAGTGGTGGTGGTAGAAGKGSSAGESPYFVGELESAERDSQPVAQRVELAADSASLVVETLVLSGPLGFAAGLLRPEAAAVSTGDGTSGAASVGASRSGAASPGASTQAAASLSPGSSNAGAPRELGARFYRIVSLRGSGLSLAFATASGFLAEFAPMNGDVVPGGAPMRVGALGGSLLHSRAASLELPLRPLEPILYELGDSLLPQARLGK